MGRKRRKNRSQDPNTSNSSSNNQWNENAPRKHYVDIKLENLDFDKYYKIQKLIPEEEWDSFMSYMKKPLPTSFRITGSKSESRALLDIIKGKFFKDILLNPIKDDEETSEEEIKPICLSWYPDELAWQLQLTRKDIRRSEAYYKLHNFLICETRSGNISRQEAVSMIPPLVLNIEPHHKVLDLCAAPGSKTAQLIEYLHRDDYKNGLPSGFVIANDVDNTRCYMLVHQAKRLSSPCVIITNHDAAIMPNIMTSPQHDSTPVRFDRVLCDVPCSGDGTLRKHADIWTKWNSANGNNLHGVQFRILKRGLELLTQGGRLVYSTCSLNPIENEAVIHRMLCEAKGSLKLVSIEDQLPGLKYVKGVTHWYPTSRDLQAYESFDQVPEKYLTSVRPSMFPPKPEDADKFNLDRCIRVFPHHQDTGGFFIAALEKIDVLPWESSKSHSSEVTSENQNEEPKEPGRKRRRIQGYKEDPFVFFNENEPIWPSIKEFYGISDDLEPNCLLTRCLEGKKKNVYYTSPIIRDIILANQGKVKFINSGIKAFARADNRDPQPGSCSFRLAQEGVSEMYKYISPQRIVNITKDDLIQLMSCEDPSKPPEFKCFHEETQKQLEKLSHGSCVLLFREETEESNKNSLNIEIVGWRGQRSLRAYTPSSDAIHYLRLCDVDVTKYDINKFKSKESSENEKEDKLKAEEDDEKFEEVNVKVEEDDEKFEEVKVKIEKDNEKIEEVKVKIDKDNEKVEEVKINIEKENKKVEEVTIKKETV